MQALTFDCSSNYPSLSRSRFGSATSTTSASLCPFYLVGVLVLPPCSSWPTESYPHKAEADGRKLNG
jgi:hypothetical protein